MNDCLWCFINNVCSADQCINCCKYLSVNSKEGLNLFNQYQKEVNEILLPLAKEWKGKMNEYTTNQYSQSEMGDDKTDFLQ